MPFKKGHPFYKGGEMGWFQKGKPSPLKGIKLSDKHKRKLSEARLRNSVRYWLGRKRGLATQKAISMNRKGRGTGLH